MFVLRLPHDEQRDWEFRIEQVIRPWRDNDSSQAIGEKIEGLIREMAESPDFDCHDVLTLKYIVKEQLERLIDGIVEEVVKEKGLEYDDTDVTPHAERRINDVIFWGNGLRSGVEGAVVVSRLSKAISFCPNQQSLYMGGPMTKEELAEAEEYMEEYDQKNGDAALRCLCDFSNAVFGMDVQLVPSKAKEDFYKGKYETTICAACPHCGGLDEFIANRGMYTCALVPWPCHHWVHPASCNGIKDGVGFEQWVEQIRSTHGDVAAERYRAKYEELLERYGPLPEPPKPKLELVEDEESSKSDW